MTDKTLEELLRAVPMTDNSIAGEVHIGKYDNTNVYLDLSIPGDDRKFRRFFVQGNDIKLCSPTD